MIVYAIIIFVAVCIGMAISVYAFGTGSKRAKIFKEIYFSVEDIDGVGVLYTKTGEFSAILAMQNPVQKYCADINEYGSFSNLMTSLMATLGEGYAIHKQDILTRKNFHSCDEGNKEFLSRSYFKYFEGREYKDCTTYITITQENKKSRLFSYDGKKWKDFLVKVGKVRDQLRDRGINSKFLTAKEAKFFVDQYLAQDYTSEHVSLNNFKVGEEQIGVGERKFKIYSLVDVDSIVLPTLVRPYTNIEVNNICMPVDLLALIDNVPEAKSVVFNQVVFLPSQKQEMSKLAKKKNRHSSLPNPSNQIAVDDITRVEELVARESKQLVHCHFNLVVTVDKDADIQKCTNYLENAFGRIGIQISQRAYNQLELFVGSFPGNCYSMNKDYDRFLTLGDAAGCLMYKEKLPKSEDTPLKVYYTDRQGVPVAIDISGKEGKKKLTDNSNFFCLGPSGSGKSFHMNSVVRQLWEQNTDVVMVDTGNSYEGLCEYVGGKYISYTEEHPITMNPFRIQRQELNVEKMDFLKNLVMLIWKGNAAIPSKIEELLIEQVIKEYYEAYFMGFKGYSKTQIEALHKKFLIETATEGKPTDTNEDVEERIWSKIKDMEDRRKALVVDELSFNTFFEYSTARLPYICSENRITGIDMSSYNFSMSEFYRGGTYERTLNENIDSSLFDETFIVFEIDTIKDNKTLFPLVTLIIMDVFIQKMRIKKNRKVLVIEEAWKAVASPMMAEYIKYLYKTARKFWAMVGVVTQELQDIIGSPIVKEAIINNSDITILLDQGKFKERFDDIKAVLGLTDVECSKIFTINRLENKEGRSFFREVFIRRGLVSDVYGVEEPRECYMTYTTERAEKEALKLYKEELRCSHQKAIEAYCRDWNLSGIDKSLAFAQKVNSVGHILNLRKQ
uniref:TraG/VirB4 family ATPase n=1 Tax=Segatella hominis TaxID=2518605 RepID=UPI0040294D4F